MATMTEAIKEALSERATPLSREEIRKRVYERYPGA